jgi:hypothetical protein
MVSFSATFFNFAISCLTHAVDYCPPLGPVYELPRNLSVDASIRLAAQNLTSTLDQLLGSRNASTPGFAPSTTSFSVGLFSTHEPNYLLSTVLLHLTSSTTKVDENTVYRIGSISKMVTVLALLLQEHKVHFDDPIIKYIPKLARYAEQNDEDDEDCETYDDITITKWSQITVTSLVSHLAGIGRVFKSVDVVSYFQDDVHVVKFRADPIWIDPFADLTWIADVLVTQFGFPALNSSDVPRCGRDAS